MRVRARVFLINPLTRGGDVILIAIAVSYDNRRAFF